MMTNEQGPARFSKKRFILCLAAWFVACLLVYMIVNMVETGRRKELIKKGVFISKDISSQSGLPLLEMKIDLLSRLIEDATQKPEVVYASIIDHKNKIIAYSDQNQLFSLNRKKSGRQEGVNFWKISGLNHRKVMTFSSEITFSGTRVGEVFISLAAEKMGAMDRPFLFFALLTLSGILSVFGVARYREGLSWWNARLDRLQADSEHGLASSSDCRFLCPLCGSRSDFSRHSVSSRNPKSHLILEKYSNPTQDVALNKLSDFEELGWFRDLIISRCARITSTILSRKA